MTDKHTLGPWRVEYNTDDYADADADDLAARYVTRIAGADDATVYYTESGYFKGRPEDVALIAAAPAMLDALRGWGDAWETYSGALVSASVEANLEKRGQYLRDASAALGTAYTAAREAIRAAEGGGAS